MSQFGVGETATSANVYFKHAAASTSVELTNGKPVDTGSIQLLLQNNPAVMQQQSYRRLISSVGQAVPSYTSNSVEHSAYHDVANYLGGLPAGGYADIFWGQNVARWWGPFWAVADRRDDTA